MAGLDINKYPQKKTNRSSTVKADTGKGSIISLLNKDISLGFNPFSDKVKERFYSELSILLEAGLDIKSSLELMESQFKKSKVRNVIRQISEQVIAGKNMSEIMQELGSFTAYEHFSI